MNPRPRGQTLVRAAAVLAGATLLAAIVLAVDLGRFPYNERPPLAARLWPTNPAIQRDEAMREIGVAAAASGGTVPGHARSTMDRLAMREPLWPEPYLVEATLAAASNAPARAERLFRAAEVRDPRAVLAHYALADRYLRTDRLEQGLGELTALARLQPGVTSAMVAPLALAARDPRADGALRYLFIRSPQFLPPVLSELAKDPAQAERAIRLARGIVVPSEGRVWQDVMVNALIAHRDYPRALAAWRAAGRVPSFTGLFNPGFRPLAARPPFNWTPIEGSAALTDPLPGRGLKVIYYGRETADLTQQLLVLSPGRYRLATVLSGGASATIAGSDDGKLEWQLRCADSNAPLGALRLDGRPRGTASLSFIVPPGCPGQWLTLHGSAGPGGQRVEVTLIDLTLTPEGGG